MNRNFEIDPDHIVSNDVLYYDTLGRNSGYAINGTRQSTFAYDDDGNQTLVTTATGRWRVTYNGENRPIRWEQIDQSEQSINRTIITMSFDRMGRRVTKNDRRFVYNGYLQVADNVGNAYVWDCTEPVATRPLVWRRSALGTQHSKLFYTHDGNKNVSEVLATDGSLAEHYEYAPFGTLTVCRSGTSQLAIANPWRFSCEYAEDDAATVYYNYRHYEPVMGRWLNRDIAGEMESRMLYVFCGNNVCSFDYLGLKISWSYSGDSAVDDFTDKEVRETRKLRKKFDMPDGIPQAWAESIGVVSVDCECKDGKWQYANAKVAVSSVVHYRPKSRYGVNGAPTFEWVQEKEQDHVNDTKKFVAAQDGNPKWKKLEEELKKKRYDDKTRCEKKNYNEIDLEVQLAILASDAASKARWDDTGEHTWK